MDNLEPKPGVDSLTSPTQPDAAELQEQLASLQRLVVNILILVLVVSCTFAYYVRRQARVTRGELDAIRPQAEAINGQYQRMTGSGLDDLAKKLAEYGAKDSQFAPIMAKYGLARAGSTGAAPATLKAPPAATSAPAKK